MVLDLTFTGLPNGIKVGNRKIKQKKKIELPYIPLSGEFIELSVGGENENSNFSVAKHGQLLGLLQKPCAALAERHLPVHRVLDPLHLNLSASHSNHNRSLYI